MEKLVRISDLVLKSVLAILLISMVWDVTWQVLTRFIFKIPATFTEELATFLLIWTSLLGSVLAYRHKKHLGLDVVFNKMGAKEGKVISYFIYILIILFSFLVMVYGGIELIKVALEVNQISAVMKIKIGYVYLILPITGIGFIFYSFYFMLNMDDNASITNRED